MSDETDETLDDRLAQLQRRAENFRELLKDGDEITLALFDGEMTVAESYRSKLERKYPKLFGRMLSIAAMMRTTWSPYFVAMLVVGVFFFGLQLSWWDDVIGREVADLVNTWWFCGAATLGGLYIAYLLCGQWSKRAYCRNRKALHELIASEKLDRDVLLVMLRDDDELENVVHELKLDAGPFPPT
jgi:hypothetical protein